MDYTLITGACGGLGRAFTEQLAERGAPLLLTGTDAEKLRILREELLSRHPALTAETFVCDLADATSRADLFSYADGKGMRFSRLVYVAGVDTQMAFEKYGEARIVKQTRVNLEGAASVLSGIIARSDLDGTCELLVVGSMSATVPMPYFALYSATKRALWQLTDALHVELKGRAKVTCVLPGGMPTRPDIVENIQTHGLFGRISAKSPEEVARRALRAVGRNRRKLVVGFWNKLLFFFECLLPVPLKMKIVAKIWSHTEKDHFA